MLSGALAASPARAFERETVEGAPGIPLVWATRVIALYPAYDSSMDVPAADVETAMRAGMREWETAGEGCTDIRFVIAGLPSGTDTNLTSGTHDGENRILFRETAWPAEAGPGVLALTTSVYRTRTGEILDSDIDINGESFFWTTTDEVGMVVNDVQNTVTHELGHLLGFAHVADADATMYGESPPGELDKRDLGGDDIAAICTVYPAMAPSPGGTGTRTSGLVGATTCSAALHRADEDPAVTAMIVAAALVLRRARRRLSRSPR
jgi:hypothetical protein